MEAGQRADSDEAKAALVGSFCGVTSATREEALFFLESHNWALDAAVQSFYDDDHPLDPPVLPRGLGGGSPDDVDEDDADDEDYVPHEVEADAAAPDRFSARSAAAAGRLRPSADTKASGSRSTIRTLADLSREPGSDADSDSEEPQEYYTGGEKSGMLVRDPSKRKHDVDAIFEQARQMGAKQGPFEPHQPSSSSRSFTGTGRLLSGETVQSSPQLPQNIVHNICFWRNGFTVNDGPLRRFDDPANASFLESIRNSECPKELEPADKRSTVDVSLIRREANCPEPVKRRAPFRGLGRTLGSASDDNPAPEPNIPPAVATAAASSSNLILPGNAGLSVDASLPSTSIQLRLADGTRMVARFDTRNTVGDIRAFIDASRAGAARNYRLQTVGFPPKQLDDVTRTIEEAGLANSVVIQRP